MLPFGAYISMFPGWVVGQASRPGKSLLPLPNALTATYSSHHAYMYMYFSRHFKMTVTVKIIIIK